MELALLSRRLSQAKRDNQSIDTISGKGRDISRPFVIYRLEAWAIKGQQRFLTGGFIFPPLSSTRVDLPYGLPCLAPISNNYDDIYQNNMTETAKIVMTGRSQAVRLPARYRFQGKEVYIRRDETTGDVILSTRPEDWTDLFAAIEGLAMPENLPDEKISHQDKERLCA